MTQAAIGYKPGFALSEVSSPSPAGYASRDTEEMKRPTPFAAVLLGNFNNASQVLHNQTIPAMEQHLERLKILRYRLASTLQGPSQIATATADSGQPSAAMPAYGSAGNLESASQEIGQANTAIQKLLGALAAEMEGFDTLLP